MKRFCAILALMVVGSCSDLCGNNELTRLPSWAGELEAVLFMRDCGATTGFSTQVSIVPSGDSVGGKGNVFIADHDHGAVQGDVAHIDWLNPGVLRIRHDPKARIFRQESEVRGVTIKYEKAQL